MAISKVTYAGNTLIDLTGDTVTPENLLSGATAHAANGEEITGIVEDKKGELEAQIEDLRNQIGSLNANLANHSALHVLPLSDIADAQNGFSITNCNVAIQGKIVLCWLSFGMNSISIPQWNDFAFAKLKSGYYPAKTKPSYPVGIIQEQTSGLTGMLSVIDNAIKINTHAVSFNPQGWCWGFIAYVLA